MHGKEGLRVVISKHFTNRRSNVGIKSYIQQSIVSTLSTFCQLCVNFVEKKNFFDTVNSVIGLHLVCRPIWKLSPH